MYRWLDADDHTVKSFNKIWNLSTIEGFKSDSEVELGALHIGELREVFVEGNRLLLNLRSSPRVNGEDAILALKKNEQLVLDYIEKNEPVVGRVAMASELQFNQKVLGALITVLHNRKLIELKPFQRPAHEKKSNKHRAIKVITRIRE
jgi:hypothetical protein